MNQRRKTFINHFESEEIVDELLGTGRVTQILQNPVATNKQPALIIFVQPLVQQCQISQWIIMTNTQNVIFVAATEVEDGFVSGQNFRTRFPGKITAVPGGRPAEKIKSAVKVPGLGLVEVMTQTGGENRIAGIVPDKDIGMLAALGHGRQGPDREFFIVGANSW